MALDVPVSPVKAAPPRAAGGAAGETRVLVTPVNTRARNASSTGEVPKPQFTGQMRHGTAGLRRTVASVRLPRPKRGCERQKNGEQCAGGQAHGVDSGLRVRLSANASGAAMFRKPRRTKQLDGFAVFVEVAREPKRKRPGKRPAAPVSVSGPIKWTGRRPSATGPRRRGRSAATGSSATGRTRTR